MDSKLTPRDILRLRTQEKGLIYIRDALSFYLMDVRVRHNFYNKTIIVLSMSTAFFETLNAEFEWSSSCSRDPDVSQSVVSIIPIAMTTLVAFISTMMKFERISDKMEETTKSIEKCHYAINRQRELVDENSCRSENLNAANLCFREALMHAETLWLSRMDPSTKRKYLKKSDRIHSLFTQKRVDKEIVNLIEHSFKPHKPVSAPTRMYHWWQKQIGTTPPPGSGDGDDEESAI